MSSNNLSALDIQAKDNLVRIWKSKQKERGFTQESAAAEIAAKANDKTNQATLGHYLNGRRRLTIKATLMFSSFLKVPPEEIAPDLDYGWGNRDWDKEAEEHEARALHQYKQNIGELPVIKDTQIQIPILDIEASGGMGAINDSELVTDNITLEKSYLHEFGLPTDNLKIITIRGDSMSPELESGDLVLVHNIPITPHEMHDGMFVIIIDDMLFIKRLQRLPGKRIKVISTNREAYDPFEVACNDVDILGRVVFAWRGKKF